MTTSSDTAATAPATPRSVAKRFTVALVGNPNVGKTTLFNALSGMQQRVGNYPGVTVERKVGQCRCGEVTFDLVDLPGTYSLAPRSPDEMVAVDVLLGRQGGESPPDVILNIVDASNLERNLYLTSQLTDLGIPLVVAVNMLDVAENNGLKIQIEQLAERLGLMLVPIQANKKKGLAELKKALCQATERATSPAIPAFPDAFEVEAAQLRDWLSQQAGQSPADKNETSSRFLVRRLLLDVGGTVEQRATSTHGTALSQQLAQGRQRLASAGCPAPGVEPRTRYAWLRERMAGCLSKPRQRPVTWTDRLDRVLTHRFWGTLIFLAVMFLLFQSIFTLAAPLMDWIGVGQEWLSGQIGGLLPPGMFRSLIVDGIIAGVGGVLVFLPQIVILFAFIAMLEDCGYVARAAFLMDRVMAFCGLSGKSFIPLLSSFACAIPGIMATRVIEDRRDRLTTILVAPLMSCSARLPVYTLLIGALIPTTTILGKWLPGFILFALYLLGIVVAPLVAWFLKRTFFRGEKPLFLMELPPYKWPSPALVLHRTYDRGKAFVVRAGTLILATMIVVWALLYFPHRGVDEQGVSFSYDERLQRLSDERDEIAKKKEAAESDVNKLRQRGSTAAQPYLEIAGKQLESLTTELEAREAAVNHLRTEWKEQSILGRMGKTLEPAFEPLGWDWRITMAALASFPAREVMVGTLGIIYELGDAEDEESEALRDKLRDATWPEGTTRAGQTVFTIPVALSVMVFFALCAQCASTLAVIKRETNSWRWPAFTFAYMTGLAYVGALLTYQIGSWLGSS